MSACYFERTTYERQWSLVNESRSTWILPPDLIDSNLPKPLYCFGMQSVA
jgi:hypothetical protein